MNDSHFASPGAVTGLHPRRWHENFLVLLLYVFLTMVLTYPVVFFLRTKVPGGPEDNFHFLWELWYVAHAIFDLHRSPFFDPDVFVPFGFSLIRNQDLSPGTVLLFSPLTHFFGEVFTYNFLVLVSFPLTAFGGYLLARELWSNRTAAILAGIIIGFCPYRFAHSMGHLSIVSTEWIPFFFLYLERLISRPRLKSAVLAGVFFGLSAWTTWYYFFMVPIAAAFYVAFRINWRELAERRRRVLKLSLISASVALAFVLPFLVSYYRATQGAVVDYHGAGESQAFAAALADYIIPPTTHFLWGLHAGQLWRNGPNGLWQSEWQLYLGTAGLFLAAAGVFHRRRRIVLALIAMALGCLLFSFGPGIYFTHPPPLSSSTNDVALSSIPAPGRLLRQLPGFNHLRSWARLGFFVELAVGLLAAAGLVRLLDWLKERFHAHPAAQLGLVAFVTGLVLFDVFPRPMGMSPVRPRAADQWLSKQPGEFVFMEYPIPRHAYGGPAIYSTRLTGKRIIMGNAQNPPNLPFWSDLSAFPSPSTLDLLYGWGAKYVLVDENLYRAGVSFWNIYQTWSTLESAIKASPRLREVRVLDGVHVYQINSGDGEINGAELLPNGNFEQGNATALLGWEIIGKPNIDRTGKHSFSADAAYAVTPKDLLVSEPVSLEPGKCYRMSVRFRSDPPKLGTLRLRLKWSDGKERGLTPQATAIMEAPSAPQWQHQSMTIQTPIGTKYATLCVEAAGGRVWVDDCSLKKLTNDCEPVLFVTPNPVSIIVGQLGRAAISWNTYQPSEGRVTVTMDGGAEAVFARGRSGLQMLDGIKPGAHCQFRLYSGQNAIPAKAIEVTAVERTATITAEPNPVPAGAGLGRTQICWATLTGEPGQVYVSQNAGPEHLFASSATGCTEARWIAAGSEYEFRLYTNNGSRRLVAKVLVTR